MTAAVKKSADPVFFIAAVFFIRIYSLFSFVALIADFLFLSDPVLISIALASYPLFQAIGQIPFGILSDKTSPLFTLQTGLALFALATALCCFSSSPLMLIASRALQGICALGAPAQAWLASLSSSSHQLQSRYYLIGLAIVLGLFCAFATAAAAHACHAPVLIFVLTLLGIVALLLLSLNIDRAAIPKKTLPDQQGSRLCNPVTLAILCANALLHFLQSAILGGIRPLLDATASFSSSSLMTLSLVLALCVCARPLRRRDYQDSLGFSQSLALLLAAISGLSLSLSVPPLITATGLLVGIFSLLLLLEAALPVGLKQQTQSSGRVLGVYNTVQYGAMSLGSISTLGSAHFQASMAILSVCSLALWALLKGAKHGADPKI